MGINIPLAERLRPKSLDDYIGQKHLIGGGQVLRLVIENGNIPSLILWGPPGVGKTSLANVISQQLKLPFFSLSAINAGVKEVRDIIEKAKHQSFFGSNKPILFLDEIHRFSKSQQDALLGAVESGIFSLIGATTENPSFEIIPALLSRCHIYILHPLLDDDLLELLNYAIRTDYFLKQKNIVVKETNALFHYSGGDGRKLLNILELVVNSQLNSEVLISNEVVTNVIHQRSTKYDKGGEQHYDIISAFIKSIRGSDPNASVYWLARMIEGGEDPLFIARRMVILASEDIGNANPTSLILAMNCFQAVAVLGLPECRIVLSQCAIYLASSPKSNASYQAISEALTIAKEQGDLPVPLHIRNAPNEMMKKLGYGKDYLYSHNFENNFILQEFLPDNLIGMRFFNPGDNSRENEMRQFLKKRWGEKYNY